MYALAGYGVLLTGAQARDDRNAFFRAPPGLRVWHRWEPGRVDRLFRAGRGLTRPVHHLAGFS